MAKIITFSTEAEKKAAIASEKANHPTPTAYQEKHLADLESAEVTG